MVGPVVGGRTGYAGIGIDATFTGTITGEARTPIVANLALSAEGGRGAGETVLGTRYTFLASLCVVAGNTGQYDILSACLCILVGCTGLAQASGRDQVVASLTTHTC